MKISKDEHFISFAKWKPTEGEFFYVRFENEMINNLVKNSGNFNLHTLEIMVGNMDGTPKHVDPETLEFYNQGQTYFDDVLIAKAMNDRLFVFDKHGRPMIVGVQDGALFCPHPVKLVQGFVTELDLQKQHSTHVVPVPENTYFFAENRLLEIKHYN